MLNDLINLLATLHDLLIINVIIRVKLVSFKMLKKSLVHIYLGSQILVYYKRSTQFARQGSMLI